MELIELGEMCSQAGHLMTVWQPEALTIDLLVETRSDVGGTGLICVVIKC